MTAYNYSNTSTQTTLADYLSPTDNVLTPVDATAFPVAYPYTLVVDYGQSAMEIVTVTGLSGSGLAVDRGQDGTAAQEHLAGAAVVHAVVARDVAAPQQHINSNSGHGVSGDVVGTTDTQTLTNKAIDGGANTLTNIPDSAIVSLSASKLTGDLNAPAVLAGAISATSLAATGSITGASVTASGALSGASAAVSGAVTAGSATVSGAVSAGSLSAPTLTTTGNVTVGGDVLPAGDVRPRKCVATTTVSAAGLGNAVAFFANPVTGYVGKLMQLQVNSVNQFYVDEAGNVVANGDIRANSVSLPRGLFYAYKRTTLLADIVSDTEIVVYSKTVTLLPSRTYRIRVAMNVTPSHAGVGNAVAKGMLRDGATHLAHTGAIEMNATEWYVGHVEHLYETGTSSLTRTFNVSALNPVDTRAIDVTADGARPFLFEIEDVGAAGVLEAA